ncbi:nodulation protein NfeD related protein, partial [mine drainage metagenome]
MVINLDEQIDPGSAAMIGSALSSLSPSSTAAVVIVMNTPGGLLSDMLTIINSINQTEGQGGHGIPVYTYVTPNGMAASAGSYIAMACDQIYMGPGSFIGPSTPIVTGGSAGEQAHVQGAMEALMISMAQAHGRNSTSAIAAVTTMVVNNTAYSAIDAKNAGIINGMSSNLTDFMTTANL